VGRIYKGKRKKRLPPLVRYDPKSPGALNLPDSAKWRDWLDTQGVQPTSRKQIARLFDDFKQQVLSGDKANTTAEKQLEVAGPKLHEIRYVEPSPPEPDRSTIVERDRLIVSRLLAGEAYGTAEDFRRDIPLFTNDELSQIISVARAQIDNDETSPAHKTDARKFLNFLRTPILRRGDIHGDELAMTIGSNGQVPTFFGRAYIVHKFIPAAGRSRAFLDLLDTTLGNHWVSQP
jgi:hypothetical protein